MGTTASRYSPCMASIENHGPSWRTIWRFNGKKQRTTWPSPELAEQAREIVEAHRHRVDEQFVYDAILGKPQPSDDEPPKSTLPTFRAWTTPWLSSKTRLTPRTRRDYERQLENRIYPIIGDIPIDEFDSVIIGNLLNQLLKDLKETTVTRYYSLIHASFAAAVRDKRIADNPAKRTDFIRDMVAHDDEGEETRVYLTPHEYDLLRAAFPPEERPFIDYLGGTGARWSEATAAAIETVTQPTKKDSPKVKILRAWKRDERAGRYLGATKGRSKRTLKVTPDLWGKLKPLATNQPKGTFLFRGPTGAALDYHNYYKKKWLPALARAMRCPLHPPADQGAKLPDGTARGRCRDYGGIRSDGKPCGASTVPGMTRCRNHCGPTRNAVSVCECDNVLHRRPTPHDLRHTHAAWLFSAGVPPLAISRRLGHKDLATTSEIYGGLMPEVEDASVEALETAMGAGKEGGQPGTKGGGTSNTDVQPGESTAPAVGRDPASGAGDLASAA